MFRSMGKGFVTGCAGLKFDSLSVTLGFTILQHPPSHVLEEPGEAMRTATALASFKVLLIHTVINSVLK